MDTTLFHVMAAAATTGDAKKDGSKEDATLAKELEAIRADRAAKGCSCKPIKVLTQKFNSRFMLSKLVFNINVVNCHD